MSSRFQLPSRYVTLSFKLGISLLIVSLGSFIVWHAKVGIDQWLVLVPLLKHALGNL